MSASSSTETILNEPFVIVADLHGIPMPATLIRQEKTLAHFTIEGYLEINDTVLACPRDETYYEALPPMDVIRDHPERLSGKIIRIDENEIYTIRITTKSGGSNPYHLRSGSSSIYVNEEDPFCVIVALSGRPDLPKFVRFHDLVKEHSTRCVNLLIDLSGVEKLPQTASAIFNDLIQSLLLMKRRIAIINPNILSDSFVKGLSQHPRIFFFRGQDDAQRYFQRYPISILIVEDDEVTMEKTKALLKRRKLYPIPAKSGEEAIQILEDQKPDMILMDIHLPGINGIETIRKIREESNLQDVPVIMVTSESNKTMVKAGYELKVNGYVLKPFDSDTLTRKILAALTD